MRRPFFLLVLLLAALPLAPLGCETVPYTGRRQLQLVSSDEEAKMGVQSFQEITGKAPLSTDAQANEMVQRVGSRIAKVAGLLLSALAVQLMILGLTDLGLIEQVEAQH